MNRKNSGHSNDENRYIPFVSKGAFYLSDLVELKEQVLTVAVNSSRVCARASCAVSHVLLNS